MADGDDLLRGVDAPRPMPAGLRRRVEESLLAGAALPDDARERLADRLTDPAAALLADVDGPRPMPAALRGRLEQSMKVATRRHARPRGAVWLAAAAVVLLVASVGVLVTRPSPHRRGHDLAGRAGGGGVSDAAGAVSAGAAASNGVANLVTPTPVVGDAGVGHPGFAPPPSNQGGGLGPVGAAPQALSDPPPFALAETPTLSAGTTGAPGGAPATTTTTAPPPPFRIAAVSGDSVEQAGFDAYVKRLNDAGGAGRRRFEVVGPADHPDAVVNLSGTPLAAAPTTPALDALLTTEPSLRDDDFDFAGVPERQGHLIADAVYPAAANATAVVYHEPSGVLGNEVPAAIAAVLKARGVTVVDMAVEPGRPVVPVPADAVFLSLTADDAKAVVAAYAQPPARGFNGIVTLADTSVARGLPAGVRVLSPYAFPANAEADVLAHDTGLPLSARLVHGWVAAKTLAVAVWREDPRSPAAVRKALEDMAGYSNGFAPAYRLRAGTHSVEPEGVLLVTTGSGFAQQGDFRTDAF